MVIQSKCPSQNNFAKETQYTLEFYGGFYEHTKYMHTQITSYGINRIFGNDEPKYKV